jgi:hypothetical protein
MLRITVEGAGVLAAAVPKQIAGLETLRRA